MDARRPVDELLDSSVTMPDADARRAQDEARSRRRGRSAWSSSRRGTCTVIRSSTTLSVRPRPYLDLPSRARVVAHDHLGDARARPLGVDRDEPVHLAVEAHRLEDLAAVGLERAAVVVQAQPADAADQPVGDARRQLAGERRVLAVLAPAGDDVVALLELVEQARDVGRIVLEVGVHRDDDVAARARRSRPPSPRSGRSCGGSGPGAATGACPAASHRRAHVSSREPSSTTITSVGRRCPRELRDRRRRAPPPDVGSSLPPRNTG